MKRRQSRAAPNARVRSASTVSLSPPSPSLLVLPCLCLELGLLSPPQLPLSPVAIPSSVSGLPWWLSGKKSACERRRRGFNPWIGKIPSRRKWQPTPVILPGKSHGQRSLACYSPWGLKELDTPSTHTLLLLDQGFSRHQIRSLEFTLCTASSVSSPPPSAAQL